MSRRGRHTRRRAAGTAANHSLPGYSLPGYLGEMSRPGETAKQPRGGRGPQVRRERPRTKGGRPRGSCTCRSRSHSPLPPFSSHHTLTWASSLPVPKGAPLGGRSFSTLKMGTLRKGRGRGGTGSHRCPPPRISARASPCRAGAPKLPKSACKERICIQTLHFTGQQPRRCFRIRAPAGQGSFLPASASPLSPGLPHQPRPGLSSFPPLHQLHFPASGPTPLGRGRPSGFCSRRVGCCQHTASAGMCPPLTPSF